jgi:hypothetical protein
LVATAILLWLGFNEPPQEVRMRPVDPTGVSLTGEVPLPSAAESPEGTIAPSRVHLVVVTTRPLDNRETAHPGASLRTRFWHPRDRRWSENDFESLEHARCLFVDESGWVLRQEQALDAPLAREWIFEAHRIDFTRSSKEQILRDIGMTPDGVNRLLDEVKRSQPDQ